MTAFMKVVGLLTIVPAVIGYLLSIRKQNNDTLYNLYKVYNNLLGYGPVNLFF